MATGTEIKVDTVTGEMAAETDNKIMAHTQW